MATVWKLLQTPQDFYSELQERADLAEARRLQRFKAVMLLQRYTRGYLIRKWVAWLSYNATIIQCAFRVHQARKARRAALRRAVRSKHGKFYAKASIKMQSLWRGHYSRRTKFCYRSYRKWLQIVTERGHRRAAEAAEFGLRSRADNLRILEEEARQWLAFVVFKLHHLLRTQDCAGVFSEKASNELSEFEKLLKAIKYTDYMKRLRRKYEEYVKQHKAKFSNKRLFPIIGVGADYWYLSLPEMYELTAPPEKPKELTRHMALHHGKIHQVPFLWRNVKPPCFIEGRGPYTPQKSVKMSTPPPPPSPTRISVGDSEHRKDPRFYLYVKYYKPRRDVLDYIDYHINVVLTRKGSIQKMDVK